MEILFGAKLPLPPDNKSHGNDKGDILKLKKILFPFRKWNLTSFENHVQTVLLAPGFVFCKDYQGNVFAIAEYIYKLKRNCR
jgi:hypothetical protein